MDQSPAPNAPAEKSEKPRTRLSPLAWACAIFLIFFVVGLAMGTGPGGILKQATHNARMQQGRQIGQAMFSYSTDNTQNGNAYPDGPSSTAVFQELLNKGYVTDPMLFYIPMPGKVPPVAGQKLKPENVSFDVTGGVTASDSDFVPLVYMTGFRMIYTPGASSLAIVKPFPDYQIVHHWLFFSWTEPDPNLGAAVFYKGNNAVYLRAQGDSIPNFVPPTFDAKGKTYRQLTPDGVLAPEAK